MPFSTRPDASEYGEFFAGYVAKVEGKNIIPFLRNQLEELDLEIGELDENVASMVQPPFSWTIKQLMGHLIDGEKVFGYRLHRIACGDATPLPGFDHEPFVENLDYENVTCGQLLEEFATLRAANVMFLLRLPAGAEERSGSASDSTFTVRSLAFVIGGHVQHHLEILRKRLTDAANS